MYSKEHLVQSNLIGKTLRKRWPLVKRGFYKHVKYNVSFTLGNFGQLLLIGRLPSSIHA